MHFRSLRKILVLLAVLAGLVFTGCGVEDYARDEGFIPQPINEIRAERVLADFADAIGDGDYRRACDFLVPRAGSLAACPTAMEEINLGSGLGPTQVVGSDITKQGLWVETEGDLKILLREDLIANIELPQ